MSCVIIISLLGRFEMFQIKIIFFLNSYFRIETLVFCFLSFEGRESYTSSKSMAANLATGRRIL